MKNSTFDYIAKKEIKKSITCKIIEIPLYKCRIKILFGYKAKQLEKDWNSNYKNYGGLTRNYLDQGDVLISFPSKKPKLEYVVHELYHAVDMILDDIGHVKSKGGDEPSAYLMGYLFKEYLKLK